MFGLSRGMTAATLVHAVFSQYGDVMAACFNLLNVPIKDFFRESLANNYGVSTEETFELLFSLAAATQFFGLMIGFATSGILMDKVGRKETAVYIRGALGIFGSISMILSFLTGRCEFYVMGHLISGAVLSYRVVMVIYMAECSPDDKRGLISMAINSGSVVVVMSITPLCLPELLGTTAHWYLVPCVCIALATIHIVIGSFFPQSPKQLFIQKNNEEAAREAIKFYHGRGEDIDLMIDEMQAERKMESHESASLSHILKHKTYRFAFFLVLLCAFIPVVSAFNIKSQYLVGMLLTYGLTQSQATTAMMSISALSLPVCFASPLLIEKFGRKPIFVTITILCSIEWMGLGLAQILVDVKAENLTFSWLCACFSAILGQSATNLGLLIMSPIMISEICPHNTRASISQLTQTLPIGFAAAEVFLFPTLKSTFGSSLFFVLGAACASLAILLNAQDRDHEYMMETSGQRVDHIVNRIRRSRANSTTSNKRSDYGSLSTGLDDMESFVSMHRNMLFKH